LSQFFLDESLGSLASRAQERPSQNVATIKRAHACAKVGTYAPKPHARAAIALTIFDRQSPIESRSRDTQKIPGGTLPLGRWHHAEWHDTRGGAGRSRARRADRGF
jgi:hypothetical protein